MNRPAPPSREPSVVVSPQNVNVIRNDFYRHHAPSYWTPDWYSHHSRAWHCPVPPGVWWHRPAWSSCWGWFATGFFAGVVVDRVIEPIPYYYGSNVYYRNGMVYVSGVPYVSAEEYYAQAQRLAATPAQININVTNTTPTVNENNSDEWLPLGTFAILATPDATSVTRVLQLATNKTGQVRGNIVDTENDRVYQVVGAVDAKTQRVALSPIDDQKMVIECGLWNLTQDTLTALVHRDASRSEERTLVRLTEPEEGEQKAEPKSEPPIL